MLILSIMISIIYPILSINQTNSGNKRGFKVISPQITHWNVGTFTVKVHPSRGTLPENINETLGEKRGFPWILNSMETPDYHHGSPLVSTRES